MEMIKVSNYNGDLFSVPKDYNKSISNFNKKPRISMFNKKTQSVKYNLRLLTLRSILLRFAIVEYDCQGD